MPVVKKCKKSKNTVDSCIRANVKHVAKEVETYPSIKKFVESSEVKIVGAYYSFETGKVEIIP